MSSQRSHCSSRCPIDGHRSSTLICSDHVVIPDAHRSACLRSPSLIPPPDAPSTAAIVAEHRPVEFSHYRTPAPVAAHDLRTLTGAPRQPPSAETGAQAVPSREPRTSSTGNSSPSASSFFIFKPLARIPTSPPGLPCATASDSASSIGRSGCSPPTPSPSSLSPRPGSPAGYARRKRRMLDTSPRCFVRSIVVRVQPARSASRCIPIENAGAIIPH